MGERINKARENICAGLLNRIVSILVPFITRTILLRIMSADYLGLDGLFISIINVLNFAELGIDSAITFNMYKPLAEGDTDTVCALVAYYRKTYRRIGAVIFGLGLLCVPLLKYIITSEVPADISTTPVFFIYLFNTALAYFLFGHKKSLLIALQRSDITSNISTIIIVAQNAFQVFIFLITRDFYAYLIAMPISTLATHLLYAIIADKKYPQYVVRGNITKGQKQDIHKQVSGLMVSKISQKSRNAFDNMVVSSLINLAAVTMYSNYFFVIISIHGILSTTLFTVLSIVGNSIVTENKQKNLKDFRLIQFIYMWISIWAMACTYMLYQDFMMIWAGEKLLLSSLSMSLFVVYGFMMAAGDVKALYIDAYGLWWHKRFFSIVEVLLNLVLNLVLGLLWGINGIVVASIISLVFANWLYGPYVLFKYGFDPKDARDYLIKLAILSVEFILVCFLTEKICSAIVMSGWLLCVAKVIMVSVIVGIFIFINYLCQKDARDAFILVRRLLHRQS